MSIAQCSGVTSRFPLLRRGAWLFLFLFLLGCTEAMTPEERVERARLHHADGESRSALIELRNALQREPMNAEARGLLGRVYLELEQIDAAEKELSRALELGAPPEEHLLEYASVLLRLGRAQEVLGLLPGEEAWDEDFRNQASALRARAHVALGETEEAKAALEEAGEPTGRHADTHLGHGELALALGREEAAREWLTQGVGAHPENAGVWRALARLELFAGNPQAAEEALDHAIRFGARAAEDRLLRARLRVERGDPEAARDDLSALGRGGERHPRVLFVRALASWVEHDFDAACSDLQEVVSRASEHVEARLYHGACQLRGGQLNQALRHVQWVHQRNPSPEVARLLAAVHLAQGNLDEARAVATALATDASQDSAETRLLLSHIERQRGDTAAALEHFRQVAQMRPDDPLVRVRLGTGLLELDDPVGSAQAFGEALEMDPDLEAAGALLVITHLRAGDHAQAYEEAQSLLERAPDAALSWTLLGLVHLAREEAEAAGEAFEEAVSREPGDPAARYYLAQLALAEGDRGGARRHFGAALERHADSVPVLLALARLEAESGDTDGARRLLEQARAADPDALRPRLVLGAYYLANQEPGRTLRILKGTGGDVPGDPRALELAGRAYVALEDADGAIEYLERLVVMRPGEVSGHLLLAEAYTRAGRSDQALGSLGTVLDLDPGNRQALMIMARVRMREGRLEEARELVDRLPEELANTPFALETRAGIALRAGDPDRAVSYYRAAVEEEPTGALTVALSRALYQAGRPGEAIEALEAFVATAPEDPDSWLALGDLLARQDRDDDALAAYQEALARDRSSVHALNNAAWLLKERQPDQALSYAIRATTLNPQSPAVFSTLETVLSHHDDPVAAGERLAEAVAGAPDVPALRYHLATMMAAAGETSRARAELRAALDAEGDFEGREAARVLLTELEARPE